MTEARIPQVSALRFVVLIGVVSLFADMTYEGARSITGPYLAVLGASGTIVGIVAGFGLFWFLGSALLGVLYDMSITSLIVFSVLAQLASLPLFLLLTRAYK